MANEKIFNVSNKPIHTSQISFAPIGAASDPRNAFFPPRYAEPWRAAFEARVQTALLPGVRILDIGSGRRPAIPLEQRPEKCTYVGLDLSRDELQKAPVGSYDDMIVADVVCRVPELEEQFDLIVSWQVLEHVKPLDAAIENLHRYLRADGRLVALLSGSFSLFGLLNRVVPQRFGAWCMSKLLRRDPASVFPAYYHHCWFNALEKILHSWNEAEVLPLYRGASYFNFLPALRWTYLKYEEWAMLNTHPNLATHYLIHARK